jgi:hypothetical protein
MDTDLLAHEDYPHEQFGGLVTGIVRAARSDEKEDTSDLDIFIKTAAICKQSLFSHIINNADSQSPDALKTYEKILSDVYKCILAKSCDHMNDALSYSCMNHLKSLIDIYDETSVIHTHWLKRLFKEAPYAFNMRGAELRKKLA